MSLTRAQWIEMWNICKSLERETMRDHQYPRRTVIREEVAKIKAMIESVIGQME